MPKYFLGLTVWYFYTQGGIEGGEKDSSYIPRVAGLQTYESP